MNGLPCIYWFLGFRVLRTHSLPDSLPHSLQGKLIVWRSFFVTHLLVILVLGAFDWARVEGRSMANRRTEAFNVLVFGEIGYAMTTRCVHAPQQKRRGRMG